MNGPSAQFTVALQSDKTWTRYSELAMLVEDLGFDGLSVYGDLGFQPPLAALLAAARATKRLRLGPACLNPFLLHPVEIAGQHAALDDASAGRAYLGLTRGSWLDRVGVVQDRPLAVLADTIAIVRRLIGGDLDGYDGPTRSIAPGVALTYAPYRPTVDVVLGVWGPRGAALAGRLADEVKLGGSANPRMVATMRSWIDDAAIAAGRQPGSVRLAVGAVCVVDRDGRAARSLARREVAMYADVVAGLDPTVELDPLLIDRLRGHLRAGRHEAAGGLLSDETLRQFSIAGSPDEVAAHTAELLAAGADRVEYGTPHGLGDGVAGLRLLGRHVVTAVKSATVSTAGAT